MSRVPQAKNRAPAPIQITAEQLLREARDRGLEDVPKPPKQYITDSEELRSYQVAKRKEFEDSLRIQRKQMSKWVQYGTWEGEQKEFERARSVFERAIDVDYRSEHVWSKYAEMEMKNKFVNHARNVWDRCVTLHPRSDNFWLKYVYMEELAGAIEACRQVFERWMAWEPADHGWFAYIKFEVRNGQPDRARGIYNRYVTCHPTPRAYLKYAKWEESVRLIGNARAIYERATEEVHESRLFEDLNTGITEGASSGNRDGREGGLLLAFARFEERQKEFERAEAIYRYAITRATEMGADAALLLLNSELVAFQKRHGEKASIEDAILSKRRAQYEQQVEANRYDYDSWFDYCRLEESEYRTLRSVSDDVNPYANPDSNAFGLAVGSSSSSSNSALDRALRRAREVYERAIGNTPVVREKRYWRRYVYLWINYALFEELEVGDIARTRKVYMACLAAIPHRSLTFGKIWLMAAHFEVRQRDLPAARKLLGQALGICADAGHCKENIFRGYAQLELQLGEIDRCRKVYTKALEVMPYNCRVWCAYANLEASCGEAARARALYEIAISQGSLDMPEVLWKAYIEFECSEMGSEEADGEGGSGQQGRKLERGAGPRALYRRLLDRANHVKVWIAFGQFEASLEGLGAEGASSSGAGGGAGGLLAARSVFQEAYDTLKSQGLKEERVLLLEAWRDVELAAMSNATGIKGEPGAVEVKMPRKVKARRKLRDEQGQELGWEEYYDYFFPDEERKVQGLKILENAMKWKKAMAGGGGGGDGGSEAASEGGSGAEGQGGSGVGSKRKAADDEIDIDDF